MVRSGCCRVLLLRCMCFCDCVSVMPMQCLAGIVSRSPICCIIQEHDVPALHQHPSPGSVCSLSDLCCGRPAEGQAEIRPRPATQQRITPTGTSSCSHSSSSSQHHTSMAYSCPGPGKHVASPGTHRLGPAQHVVVCRHRRSGITGHDSSDGQCKGGGFSTAASGVKH